MRVNLILIQPGFTLTQLPEIIKHLRHNAQRFLADASPWILVLFAGFASFATYFCMYAFRKPFAAGSFETPSGLFGSDIELKTSFAIAQLLGYTLSKYIGVRLLSGLPRARRPLLLLAAIAVAQLALLAFALLPADLRVLAMFANGLPLGLVWGLVVSYLEGRRTSELLLALLSCSFIVASGVVKDIGRYLMRVHTVSETWMPFAVGALFLIPFALGVSMLELIPPPDEHDVRARVQRRPMSRDERRGFVRAHLFGLLALFAVYFFLTAYRDYRDLYGVEIFAALGYGQTPSIFSQTEIPVALGVLAALGALSLVRDNRRGLFASFALMIFGAALLGGSTVLFERGVLSGAAWMVATGLGSYLVYVPYGSILFDRLVAASGAAGTAVFAIYLADALGYTGSVLVQLAKDLLGGAMSRLDFFRGFTYLLSLGAVCLLTLAAARLLRTRETRPQ